MVGHIFRTDAGSNYTAAKIRYYIESRGSKFEVVNIATPHQIGTAERAHGILLPTVRSLMAFANAPYSMWARCLCWACMLANITAVDYNTSEPFIPLLLTEAHIDKRKILPFGCLAHEIQ